VVETFPELRDLESAGSPSLANSQSRGKPVMIAAQILKTTGKNLIDVHGVKRRTNLSAGVKMCPESPLRFRARVDVGGPEWTKANLQRANMARSVSGRLARLLGLGIAADQGIIRRSSRLRSFRSRWGEACILLSCAGHPVNWRRSIPSLTLPSKSEASLVRVSGKFSPRSL
jgi:hypothetical protein